MSKYIPKIGDKGTVPWDHPNNATGMWHKGVKEIVIKTIFTHNGQTFISGKENATTGYYLEEFKLA